LRKFGFFGSETCLINVFSPAVSRTGNPIASAMLVSAGTGPASGATVGSGLTP
jgi:hypothetical protein